MSDPQIVTTLRRKREDLERQLAMLAGQAKATEIALSHVSAVIALYEATGDEPPAFPVHMDLSRLFKRFELWRLCEAALKAAGEPQTTRELARAVIKAKGWNVEDAPLRKAVAYRIVQALTAQAKRGRVGSPGRRGNVRLWSNISS